MGHVCVDAVLVGPRGQMELRGVLVGTGATYTMLEEDKLLAVGALGPLTANVELGDGRVVEARIYMAKLRIGDREAPILAATFPGVREVIGVQALEALGLKVNPTTGELEASRPSDTAYFYQSNAPLNRYPGGVLG